jgi:hypothetical protein
MRIKPADPSVPVRDPVTREYLPEDGADKPETSFWMRRIRDGSVVRVEEHELPTGREPIAPLTTRKGE